METIHRLSLRLLPLSLAQKHLTDAFVLYPTRKPTWGPGFINPVRLYARPRTQKSSPTVARAGWLLGLGGKKKLELPEIVKAGDPVLHETAREVAAEEIGSERIQKIIDDMVRVMRLAPGVGLAAPQIGVPLRVSDAFII